MLGATLCGYNGSDTQSLKVAQQGCSAHRSFKQPTPGQATSIETARRRNVLDRNR
jgi:hypothetical protein